MRPADHHAWVHSYFESYVQRRLKESETLSRKGSDIGVGKWIFETARYCCLKGIDVDRAINGQISIYALIWSRWEDGDGKEEQLDQCFRLLNPVGPSMKFREILWNPCAL
jgi:hypothetical protein